MSDEPKITEETFEEIFLDGTDDIDHVAALMADTGEIDDTGKTPSQILQECGVSPAEMEAAFPSDYVPLKVHPSKLDVDQLLVRAHETSKRLEANATAKSDDTVPFPSQQEINEKYINDQEESLRNSPEMRLLLDAVETFKTKKGEPGTYTTTEKLAVDDLKHAIVSIIDTADFDAKKARKLYLNKIKEQSRLTDVLQTIKAAATIGRPATNIAYLPTYDKLKLEELGFKVTRQSGRPMSYIVSWE